ncbi:2-hydroxyacid dehydrogenase [Paenibacillus swuensis]|uniref:2-hydroxyacid dehydrogenase n=1 Tax=Paenibacillus swuensis TaxID=1178515 RepID=A0A172TN39_9BACL|nr:D-2-hydroxyacid dehydrogenase [Paenibacillus swuensis]ANE48163.1 2-hydroxyacid dehydrogenase [Paenibacillus swuensis]
MTVRTLIALHGFTPQQEDQIRNAAPGWKTLFGRPKDFSADQLAEAEVLCGWHASFREILLEQPSKLRWVQLYSSGADYMPFDLLQERGIVLTDAMQVHPVPVAETVMAMLLAFSRKLHFAVRSQSAAAWEVQNDFTELRGKTLGVVGAGAIGTEVARLAGAFGMRTLGVRRSGAPVPHFDAVVPLAQLDEVLADSDVVVNVLPLTAETTGLYDQARFAAMKPTSWFINVGRGKSVHTESLVDALRTGGIAAAGLDVFEQEPLPADHPLWSMPNVIMTPHIAGNSDQLKERVTELFTANLLGFIESGRPAHNVIDYRLRY